MGPPAPCTRRNSAACQCAITPARVISASAVGRAPHLSPTKGGAERCPPKRRAAAPRAARSHLPLGDVRVRHSGGVQRTRVCGASATSARVHTPRASWKGAFGPCCVEEPAPQRRARKLADLRTICVCQHWARGDVGRHSCGAVQNGAAGTCAAARRSAKARQRSRGDERARARHTRLLHAPGAEAEAAMAPAPICEGGLGEQGVVARGRGDFSGHRTVWAPSVRHRRLTNNVHVVGSTCFALLTTVWCAATRPRTNEATENLPDYDTQGALQRKRLRMPVCSPT